MLNKEQLSSLLNFLIILVIILIVCFLLFSQFRKKTVIDNLQTVVNQELPVEKPALSEDEVDIERVKIIKMTPGTEEVVTQSESPAEVIPESEVKATIENQTNVPAITQQQYGQELTAVQVNLADYTKDSVVEQPVEAYVKPGSGISITGASVSKTSDEGEETVNVSIEGAVFSVNSSAKTIGLVEGQNPPVQVEVKSNTKITINSQPINLSSIKVGDILRVEGTKQENSSEITATSISLVGTYQLIP